MKRWGWWIGKAVVMVRGPNRGKTGVVLRRATTRSGNLVIRLDDGTLTTPLRSSWDLVVR